MVEVIDLNTEDGGFKLLELATKKGNIDLSLYDFKYNPDKDYISIHYEGEDLNGVMTVKMMETVIALQQQINRLYADISYNGNIRSLTEDDRKKLELRVKVTEGSTVVDAYFPFFLSQMITTLGGTNMTEVHQQMLFWGSFVVLYAGEKIYNAYQNKRAKVSQNDAAKLLLEAEKQKNDHEIALAKIKSSDKADKRRAKLESMRLEAEVKIQQLKQDQIKLDKIDKSTIDDYLLTEKVKKILNKEGIPTDEWDERADEIYKPTMKLATDLDQVTFGNVEPITPSVAEILKMPIPNQNIKVQLNGRYRVLIVNAKVVGIFKVYINNQDTNEEFWAIVQENDTSGIKEVLQEAEWKKQPLHLNINAIKKNDIVSDATIISAEKI